MRLFTARIRAAALTILVGAALSACATPQAAPPPTALPTEAPTVVVQPTAAPPDAVIDENINQGSVRVEEFLWALHDGRYEDAAALYAGDYTVLALYNADLAADDHAGLLRRACEVNGFTCMLPGMIVTDRTEGDVTFYSVTYRSADGNVFGVPVAGQADTMQTTFTMRVQDGPDGLRALDLPPFLS